MKDLELNNHDPIAIIGIGCRFPGNAHSPQSFWHNLINGVDSITEVPHDRWSIQRFYGSNGKPFKTSSKYGGFVNQKIELFDALFFGISPREASYIDPMQRWLLETTWEAFEDAGLVPEYLAGSDTSVFIGCFTEDIKLHQMSPFNRELMGSHVATGSAMTILANRISYIFDLHGPNLALDTACSSSLVAVHLACQSIWNKESSLALAGGANAMFRPEFTIAESKAGMLSPDGRSKAFDSSANGYVRGEGAGMIVLKPLQKALEDNDSIYAVIRSTGVNQDGRTNGITVPNGDAQQKLTTEVCVKAGISPSEIQYVEAHGTGTPVGDPIEANALASVLANGRSEKEKCWIGSVKTNIGHLEAAAGIAGLIKVALAIKNGAIPPNLHFKKPNPAIDFDNLCIKVPQKLEPWPLKKGSRIACVNSFGFGGTNAQVLLESPPKQDTKLIDKIEESGHTLLPISARSENALYETARLYRDFLKVNNNASPVSFRDLFFTLTQKKSHHHYKKAFYVDSVESFINKINVFCTDDREKTTIKSSSREKAPEVVFIFTGMGPQWWAMGRELFEQEPVFQETIKRCDELFRIQSGWSLLEQMLASESESRMDETRISQPANFALQVGLCELWKSWGITPNAILGHSAGEVAASYCAGAFSLEDAITIVYHRSRLQHQTTGKGRLAAVGLSLEEARKALHEKEEQISIAAVNSPSAVTLVGDEKELEMFVRPLVEKNIYVKFLRGNVPFHSHYLDPLQSEMLDVLRSIQPMQTKIPLYSTVTGQLLKGTEMDANYWWKNSRNSVLFASAIETVMNDGYNTFLEVGPHPVLSTSISECYTMNNKNADIYLSLRHKTAERETMLNTLAELYSKGFSINWNALGGHCGNFIKLPAYPWQRELLWAETEESRQDRIGINLHPLLGSRLTNTIPTWLTELDSDKLPYLKDHVVQNSMVFPGAGYIEMMLAAIKNKYPTGSKKIELKNIGFHKALFLTPETSAEVQLSLNEENGKISISSRKTGDAKTWTIHASANLSTLNSFLNKKTNLNQIQEEYTGLLSADECYSYLKSLGLNYGPQFRNIDTIRYKKGSSIASIDLREKSQLRATEYTLHPIVLDTCFQILLSSTLSIEEKDDKQKTYMPTRINRLTIHADIPEQLTVLCELTILNDRERQGNITGFDEEGKIILEVEGVIAASIEDFASFTPADVASYFYKLHWEPKDFSIIEKNGQDLSGFWIIFANKNQTIGKDLSEKLENYHNRQCIIVYPGTSYQVENSRNQYSINPESKEDLVQLFNETVLKSDLSWKGIVHLWGLDSASAEDLTMAELEEIQSKCPLFLLNLMQVLEPMANRFKPKIYCVTRGVQEVNTPNSYSSFSAATLWGMLSVIGYQEHTEYFGGLIDLDPASPSDEVEMLFDDLVSSLDTDITLYRKGSRYRPSLIEAGEVYSDLPDVQFKANASYLITGGLGGLGMLVARWMVENGARHLILMGRTELPPRTQWNILSSENPSFDKVKAILELEAMGGHIHIASLDVGDEHQLANYLEHYKKENWPPISGLFHAAGISWPHLINQLDRQEYINTLRPKVQGSWLLHKYLDNSTLDFFVLFSSVAAFGFTAGQSDYAAANAFMDALVKYRKSLGLPGCSINWGPWAEVGMATKLNDYFHEKGMGLLTPREGLFTLRNILQKNVQNVVVQKIEDWIKFADRNFPANSAPPLIAYQVEKSKMKNHELGKTETSQQDHVLEKLLSYEHLKEKKDYLRDYLKKLVARVLRMGNIKQLDNDISLSNLGLDSMIAMELRNQIISELRVTISVVDLLKGISINQLLEIIVPSVLEGLEDKNSDDGTSFETVTGDVPLTLNQRWFFGRKLSNPHYWHMVSLWKVTRKIDPSNMEKALELLMKYHDVLRTRFILDDNGWKQFITEPQDSIPFTCIDLSEYPEPEQQTKVDIYVNEYQKEINIIKGPIFQVVYFNLGTEKNGLLLFICHHQIADLFSRKIFINDFQTLCLQLQNNKQVRLLPKPGSYKQWAESLVEYADSSEMKKELEYWSSLNWKDALPLPIDYENGRENNIEKSSQTYIDRISISETKAILNTLGSEYNVQILDAVLSALSRAYYQWTNHESLQVGVTTHGRLTSISNNKIDVSRTFGQFAISVYCLLQYTHENNIEKRLKHYQGELANFQEHSISQAILLLDVSSKYMFADEIKRVLKPEIYLNYLGNITSESDMKNLFVKDKEVVGSNQDETNMRSHLLFCNILIKDDQLMFVWEYSKNVHKVETIQQFSKSILDALHAMCLQEV